MTDKNTCQTFQQLRPIFKSILPLAPALEPYEALIDNALGEAAENLQDPATWRSLLSIIRLLAAVPAIAPYAVLITAVLEVIITLLEAEKNGKPALQPATIEAITEVIKVAKKK